MALRILTRALLGNASHLEQAVAHAVDTSLRYNVNAHASRGKDWLEDAHISQALQDALRLHNRLDLAMHSFAVARLKQHADSEPM